MMKVVDHSGSALVSLVRNQSLAEEIIVMDARSIGKMVMENVPVDEYLAGRCGVHLKLKLRAKQETSGRFMMTRLVVIDGHLLSPARAAHHFIAAIPP